MADIVTEDPTTPLHPVLEAILAYELPYFSDAAESECYGFAILDEPGRKRWMMYANERLQLDPLLTEQDIITEFVKDKTAQFEAAALTRLQCDVAEVLEAEFQQPVPSVVCEDGVQAVSFVADLVEEFSLNDPSARV